MRTGPVAKTARRGYLVLLFQKIKQIGNKFMVILGSDVLYIPENCCIVHVLSFLKIYLKNQLNAMGLAIASIISPVLQHYPHRTTHFLHEGRTELAQVYVLAMILGAL